MPSFSCHVIVMPFNPNATISIIRVAIQWTSLTIIVRNPAHASNRTSVSNKRSTGSKPNRFYNLFFIHNHFLQFKITPYYIITDSSAKCLQHTYNEPHPSTTHLSPPLHTVNIDRNLNFSNQYVQNAPRCL